MKGTKTTKKQKKEKRGDSWSDVESSTEAVEIPKGLLREIMSALKHAKPLARVFSDLDAQTARDAFAGLIDESRVGSFALKCAALTPVARRTGLVKHGPLAELAVMQTGTFAMQAALCLGAGLLV